MPNPDLTEIAIVLDRSGSMDIIRKDMEGGFATFLAEQRKIPDPCNVSLYQFDNAFDVVYEDRPLAEAPPLTLTPRGGTALLDALARAMALIGERLARKPEAERPGKVVVLVITDGQENASREATRAQVAEKIKHQREAYNWQFAFLGANLDSFAEARSLNVSPAAVQNFQANAQGVGDMYAVSSKGVGAYRSTRSVNASLSIPKVKEEQ